MEAIIGTILQNHDSAIAKLMKRHDEVINYYNLPTPQIQTARHFQVETGALRQFLASQGVHVRTQREAQRKYSANATFFDVINSPEKAYFLGLIAADGCVTLRNGKPDALRIALQERGRGAVVALRDALNSTHPVTRAKRNGQAILTIHHPVLIQSLVSHGIHPQKSATLKWPQTVPKHLLGHYLRGYTDGDGCFYVSGKRYMYTILGSSTFLSDCQGHVGSLLKLGKVRLTKRSGIYGLAWGGRLQVQRIARYLYEDAPVYFSRKRDKIAHLL